MSRQDKATMKKRKAAKQGGADKLSKRRRRGRVNGRHRENGNGNGNGGGK